MKLCLFLLIAGILDALLTQIGIVQGIIQEGNPLIQYLFEKSWLLVYSVKVVLPLILLGLLLYHPLKSRFVSILLVSTSVLYLTVLAYHLFWILLYVKSLV